MPTLRPWILALAAAAAGCTSTTTQVTRTPLGRETRPLPSESPAPAIGAEWTSIKGLLLGRLRWQPTCQPTLVERYRDEELQTTSTDAPSTLVGVAVGLALTAASIWLVSDADSYSAEETCEADDGEVTCSSPRDAAYGLGFAGIIMAGTGTGYGIYTLFQDPTDEVVGSVEGFRTIIERSAEHIPCGTEAIHGLGLAVTRVGQVLARSTTNDASEVAFAIPPDVTGGLQVVVDAVPPHLVAWVRVGGCGGGGE
jgi:hypothetical protein